VEAADRAACRRVAQPLAAGGLRALASGGVAGDGTAGASGGAPSGGRSGSSGGQTRAVKAALAVLSLARAA
jgi:hypothetical protein